MNGGALTVRRDLSVADERDAAVYGVIAAGKTSQRPDRVGAVGRLAENGAVHGHDGIGGENQRIRLATQVGSRLVNVLYILDEPTTGLHFEDVRVLMGVLRRLVDKGNTVIIIEHNPDVIRSCDYIVDMGPDGGREGGTVVATGTVDDLRNNPHSITGRYI